jgi:DNA-binding GntR family transcriptional regulator
MDQLRQTNLRDQALAVLKLRLISGDLAPGEIYSAAALAAELGVSNSPIREAMLTLVNQGLMEAVRNRGFRVVPLSDKERQNIYDLRTMLEIPSMVRLAAHKEVVKRKNEFSAIASEIVACAKAGDIVGYLDADRRFHIGLLGILQNDQLTTIVENLRDQTRQYGLRALSEQGILVKSAKEHQPILDAILAGDKKKIATLMTDHLRHIRGDWAGAPSEKVAAVGGHSRVPGIARQRGTG